MDKESVSATFLLEALATANARLIEFSRALRSRLEVVDVLHCLECRWYLTGPMIEGYVDVEIRGRKSVAWLLDIRWPDKWLVDTRVVSNHGQYQDVLREFPTREAESLGELITVLNLAVSELISSADSYLTA